MKYIGQLVTGDFEENTMTFEIEGEMILQAGKYSIEQIEAENQVKNLGIADVSDCAKMRKALETIRDAFWSEGEPKSERIDDLKAIASNSLYEIDNSIED